MSAVDTARSFLVERYRNLIPGFNVMRDGFDSKCPGWAWVNDDLSIIQNPDPVSHGLLFDPDVGIALFLLSFQARNEISAGTDVRAQISRAIAYRSRFLPRRLEKKDEDTDGSWRVIIHWMVDSRDAQDWREQVSLLRRETAYMEELPVDAIFRADTESWDAAIRSHDLPRLLLRTREILAKESADDVFTWSSADERVRAAMQGFSDQYRSELENKLARQVEAKIEARSGANPSGPLEAPVAPIRMQSLVVRSFRNLKEINLNFSGDIAQAAVVHGPNGTGKSNLFEAIEFALNGISERAIDFLKDADVTTTKKERDYVENYLSPIGKPKFPPIVELNGKGVPLSLNRSSISSRVGTVLSQAYTEKFVGKDANELAAEILGEFSGLADELLEFAEGELARAQADLKNMLSRFGLDRPGAITRQETARDKVAEAQLRDVVSTPPHFVRLLEASALQWSPTTAHARTMASAMMAGQHSLGDFAAVISKLSSRETLQTALRSYLTPLWQSWRSADRFLESLGQLRGEWPAELLKKVDVWGRWLSERQAVEGVADNDSLTDRLKARKQLADELEMLARRGKLLRERESHFETLHQFLNGPWKDSGSQHCPTCDTDFSGQDGILKAVDSVRAANGEALSEMRKQYANVQVKLAALDKEIQLLDKSRCPLSEVEQSAVRQALTPHLPEGVGFDEMLVTPENRSLCLEWLDAVARLPMSPQFSRGSDDEARAETIAESIQTAYQGMERGFLLPEAWKKISKELKDRLASVLKLHLPQTLGGLWTELVWNLTPAPWQLNASGKLTMQVESRRGKQQVRLSVDKGGESRLARYVLNEAEKLALGLAWFLVRYISQGRFRHAVLALDDPALDMDQTTFRDLCRLMETILRIHRRQGQPLTLLIFLHQDERALDAARATGGLLYRLAWNAGDAEVAESVKLSSDTFRNPNPGFVFSDICVGSGPSQTVHSN